jgi:hypothetical protein
MIPTGSTHVSRTLPRRCVLVGEGVGLGRLAGGGRGRRWGWHGLVACLATVKLITVSLIHTPLRHRGRETGYTVSRAPLHVDLCSMRMRLHSVETRGDPAGGQEGDGPVNLTGIFENASSGECLELTVGVAELKGARAQPQWINRFCFRAAGVSHWPSHRAYVIAFGIV